MAAQRHISNRSVYPQDGFTIVEVIVTLVVVSLFLTMMFQSFFALESQRLTVVRQARSAEIAYSNLRKVTGRSIIETLCRTNGGADLLAATSPSGYSPYPDLASTLGTGAGQQLMAYPTAGCNTDGTFPDDKPIRIESTVWFLKNGERTEAVHAGLIQ